MRKNILAITLLAALSFNALAQEEAETGVLADQVKKLEERSEKLEKIVSKLPTISGFLQAGYDADFGENFGTNKKDVTNTFHIRRARLKLNGNIGKKIDYTLQADFANTPKVVDVFMRFKPWKQFNIQIGQFKHPFSIESPTYLPKNIEAINNSMGAVNLVQKYGLTDGQTGRQIGINLYGGFIQKEGYSIINYDLGVYNGNGINKKDDNNAKDISGRLTIMPIKDLKISASYYWGKYGKNKARYERYAGGFAYDKPEGLIIRSEYIGGNTAGQYSHSAYAVVGYHIGPKWTAFWQYDFYQADVKDEKSQKTNLVIGAAWQPLKYLRAQVNYYNTQNYNFTKNSNHVAVLVTGIF
ncbi:MAG: hypothetical protein IJ270_06530 [Paludibacteraceae bacterium]|nr:hypothetical protein [Paludibacteraceae bacterium]